jgi:hypothetical protein
VKCEVLPCDLRFVLDVKRNDVTVKGSHLTFMFYLFHAICAHTTSSLERDSIDSVYASRLHYSINLEDDSSGFVFSGIL